MQLYLFAIFIKKLPPQIIVSLLAINKFLDIFNNFIFISRESNPETPEMTKSIFFFKLYKVSFFEKLYFFSKDKLLLNKIEYLGL